MNPSGLNKHLIPITRILCMVIISVMLANPVLAQFIAAAGCDGNCCCCPTPDQDAYPKIRGVPTKSSDCCGANGAGAACHMSSSSQPDALPALTRTMVQPPPDAVPGMPGAFYGTFHPAPNNHPAFGAGAGPAYASSPLYLKTCRLIC